MAQQAEVAAFLRRRGATENIFDAVQAGHIEQIKTLLTANPDAARATNALKRSVLAPAADLGDVNIVELLLDHGAPVNGQPGDEDSPLLAAMSGNRTNIVRLLVERGADVNATGASGLAPLHNAAIYGSTDVAQFLIEDKADINVRVSSGNRPQPFGPPLGATPLHLAVLVGETNMIDLLLKSGADVNAVNRSGQTPLDAIMSGGRGGQWPRMGLRRNRPRQDVPGGHSSFNRQAAMALLEAAGGKHSSQLPRQYPGQ
jgi:ankyrin repeat protein